MDGPMTKEQLSLLKKSGIDLYWCSNRVLGPRSTWIRASISPLEGFGRSRGEFFNRLSPSLVLPVSLDLSLSITSEKRERAGEVA